MLLPQKVSSRARSRDSPVPRRNGPPGIGLLDFWRAWSDKLDIINLKLLQSNKEA